MQSIPLAVLKQKRLQFVKIKSIDCMQFIPLVVLKHRRWIVDQSVRSPLHAIHTACGIETSAQSVCHDSLCHCMQFIPLAVLKRRPIYIGKRIIDIACNPYRLRYFFIFRYFFSNDGFFYGIMKLSRKCFVGRDSNVCHLYDVGGYESN